MVKNIIKLMNIIYILYGNKNTKEAILVELNVVRKSTKHDIFVCYEG